MSTPWLRFVEEFKPKFATDPRRRYPTFERLAYHLLKCKHAPTIIETGTARKEGNFDGDGQSTLLWDWIARETGGKAISIDIDRDACEVAKRQCPHVETIPLDSVEVLSNLDMRPWLEKCDLLFLDSFDWAKDKNFASSFHHMKELCAAWDHLPSGCLVAVDDCHGWDKGKHVMVAEFFRIADIDPVDRGYITVWRKP